MDAIKKHVKKNLYKVSKNTIKSIPQQAGVYFFFNEKTKPIYIGKAVNLRSRLQSYFLLNLSDKTAQMVNDAKYISFIIVGSELESLLLEAELIRKYKPHYNVALKDDKHPNHIVITDESLPRVLMVRKKELKVYKFKKVFGPFFSAGKATAVLKMLRKIFPFSQHAPSKRTCLYSQMGYCSPCPSQIINTKDDVLRAELTKKYKENVKYLSMLLGGKIKYVRRSLVNKMNKYSKIQKYEEAISVRNKIQLLDYITQPIIPVEKFLENPNLKDDIRKDEMDGLSLIINKYLHVEKLSRIECYDVAHLAGSSPSASMVSFVDGDPDKNLYRHFSIRQKKGGSDTDSLSEVIKRRMMHLSDWGVPDLIIVDGGKGQVGSFSIAFEEGEIPVVGFAKRHDTLVIPVYDQKLNTRIFKEYSLKAGPAKNLVIRMRDEAHRFARRHHHRLVKKELLKN
jgi:excinuclease ABC subunit C